MPVRVRIPTPLRRLTGGQPEVTVQAATVALDVADGRFAAARARWEDAHRRAQVYRRLEDRRRAAHLAEVRRAEQAELDEWASLRMKGGDDE
ncbi:MAG: flagellar FliJ family protein [Dehalococcoidia bacterium]|nr:flagellar FliJ family protein [Dehalococcoidia bacterium]